MINLETPTAKDLNDILSYLENGEFLIPDFQRDYDWSATSIQDLLESIFNDYYIGSILLWNTSTDNVKKLDCKQIRGFNDKNINISPKNTIVLDGQQRLTSLYYAFFQPTETLKNRTSNVEFFLKIDDYYNNKENAFFYKWDNKKDNKYHDVNYLVENNIFPMTEFRIVNSRDSEWAAKYDDKYGKSETDKFIKIIERIKKYQIPIIYLKEDISIGKVCDIFEKINSRGIKLSTFDLLNAILKQYDINLRTVLWSDASEKLSFIKEDNKMYILQAMSIIEQNYCSPKYLYYLVPNTKKIIKGNNEEKVLIENKESFLSKWNQAVNSIKYAENLLKDYSETGYGILKEKFFPYVSMIPVFSTLLNYLAINKIDSEINQKKIRKWWFYSIFSNNYSSSVESTMAKDYQNMIKWFNNEENEIKDEIENENQPYIFNVDLSKEKQGAIYKSILNLIIVRGGRDFYKGNSLALHNLEDHHIVPKAKCKEIGIENAKIDSILNRTLISDDTNLDISDSLPADYIKNKILPKYDNDIESVKKMFVSHFITEKAFNILMRDNFNAEDFSEFIEERKITISKYINKSIFGKNEE